MSLLSHDSASYIETQSLRKHIPIGNGKKSSGYIYRILRCGLGEILRSVYRADNITVPLVPRRPCWPLDGDQRVF